MAKQNHEYQLIINQTLPNFWKINNPGQLGFKCEECGVISYFQVPYSLDNGVGKNLKLWTESEIIQYKIHINKIRNN